MAVNGIALATLATGSVFVYAGITGKSVLKSVQAVVSGQPPALLPVDYPITGQPANAVPDASSASSGSTAQYQAYAFSQFSKYGWGADQQSPLITLWNNESGWNPAARNPASGAAGIPQDISGNTHGGWQGQIDWGLQYIKGRYGTPAAALAFWNAQNPHWY